MVIFNRFPHIRQILPVYAICVIIIYTWTTLWFFWQLPSWLFYMNAGELALIYAYVLATNFLESLLVLSAPIILSFILPPKWFRDLFVARGTSLVIFGLGYAMLLASQFQNRDDYPGVLLKVWSVALAIGVIVLLVFVAGKTPFIKRAVEVIAEHATIFLYVYVPLSLISLIVVLPRIL